MHRYEELEKLYYRKKNIKLLQYSFIIIILILGILFILKDNIFTKSIQKLEKVNKQKIEHKIENKNIELNKIDKNISVEKKKQQKIIKKEIKKIKKLTLYPIFPDISNIKNEKKYSEKENIDKNETKQIKKIAKPKEEKKTEIKIIIKQQKQTLTSLIRLYKLDPKYHTAIKIAYMYFDKKDYANSIKWAKIANKIEPENDESWYLFSKSLLQLGNRKKAKEVLVVYLNTYGTSEKIEKLLRSIK